MRKTLFHFSIFFFAICSAQSFATRTIYFNEPFADRSSGDRIFGELSVFAPNVAPNVAAQTVTITFLLYDCPSGTACGNGGGGALLSSFSHAFTIRPGQSVVQDLGGGPSPSGRGMIMGSIAVAPDSGFVVAGGVFQTVQDSASLPNPPGYPNYIVNHTIVINGGMPF